MCRPQVLGCSVEEQLAPITAWLLGLGLEPSQVAGVVSGCMRGAGVARGSAHTVWPGGWHRQHLQQGRNAGASLHLCRSRLGWLIEAGAACPARLGPEPHHWWPLLRGLCVWRRCRHGRSCSCVTWRRSCSRSRTTSRAPWAHASTRQALRCAHHTTPHRAILSHAAPRHTAHACVIVAAVHAGLADVAIRLLPRPGLVGRLLKLAHT